MIAKLSVVTAGLLTTFQDFGRHGFRRFGVPRAGVLHPDLAVIANALAENAATEAVLEFFYSGPSLSVEAGPVRFAFAGDFKIRLLRNGTSYLVRSWRTLTLENGDTLQVGPVVTGKAGYIAISGGFEVPSVLKSCSTYLRGGFGGLDGKRLQSGSVIYAKESVGNKEPERYLPIPPGRDAFGGFLTQGGLDQVLPIRVILGPQDDYFTDEALTTFLSATYTVTRASDRMGIRLDGPRLQHRKNFPPEIISDGIVPGAIQVPGNGIPIALLADAQTVGGYPKIATIASVDLGKLAVLTPGRQICFTALSANEGAELLISHRQQLAQRISGILPIQLAGRDRNQFGNTGLATAALSTQVCFSG